MSAAVPTTIYALSTPPGRSAIAVVRLSGPRAEPMLCALAGRLPPPRRAVLRKLRDGAGVLLDEALVLWLPGPASFTGEDMAELHCHGGRAVVAGVLAALAVAGAVAAGPGDFTARAFAAGRLDLSQVEGLADLIEAETASEANLALAQAGGALRRQGEAWRARLLMAQARLAAELDFADEADVPVEAVVAVRPDMAALAGELRAALTRAAELRSGGLMVVLAGPPNAGKSSLLNALTQREAALVSAEPGTTRDVIEVALDLGGVRVTLADTAGLREATGVEALGIARTRERLAAADIVLWLSPADAPVQAPPGAWALTSKADLGHGDISALTGAGVPELLARLQAEAAARQPKAGDVLITRARQIDCLAATATALESFAAGNPAATELRAEDLRAASHALARLVGAVETEQVLGEIFARFCIGK